MPMQTHNWLGCPDVPHSFGGPLQAQDRGPILVDITKVSFNAGMSKTSWIGVC